MSEQRDCADEWHDGYDEGYADGREEIARELEVENARYHGALARIARAESGIWGRIAGEALRRSHARVR